MKEKKAAIKARFGSKFTYLQQFCHCWQKGWAQFDEEGFKKQRDLIATACQIVKEHITLTHRDRKLEDFGKLSDYFKANIFGAGDLTAPTHLIPIMSMIGVLLAWIATISSLKSMSRN